MPTSISKIILILFLLACRLFSYSQTDFIFKYATSSDEYPNDIIETSDHGYILSISTGTYPSSYQTLLIRLNNQGDTVKTKMIIQPQGACYINDLLKLDNGNYLGIGERRTQTDASRLWLITLNDSLEILNDTSFLTVFTSCGHLIYGFIDHSNNLIVYGSAKGMGSQADYYPFVFKFSLAFDYLFFHYYTNPWQQYVYSMMEKPDLSGYIMSLYGCMNPPASSPSQFVIMDYSFNITSLHNVPGALDLYLNTVKLNNSELFVSGKRTYGKNKSRTDKIGILKLDLSLNKNKEYFLGPEDTVTYPAYNTNLSFLDVNNIYLGGIVNEDYSGVFSNNKSYILLGKFDSSLNLKWQKYFGGDMYYMAWSVIATTDGGCIIGGTSNDYASQGENRDLYIIKVDSNGIITGINEKPPLSEKQCILYPNPGKDFIYVETQLSDTEIAFLDLPGKEILRKILKPGKNMISVSGFHSGIYIYRLSRKDQIKESGKWIKE